MKKFVFLAANPWGKSDKIIVHAESKREARFILLRCGYRNIEFYGRNNMRKFIFNLVDNGGRLVKVRVYALTLEEAKVILKKHGYINFIFIKEEK